MKKVLYLLLAAITLGSCSKDVEFTDINNGNKAISFSISGEATRNSETNKESWTEGDIIAIFKGTVQSSKLYVVESVENDGSCTLLPNDVNDAYMDDANGLSFTAYYPYIEDYTLNNYKSLSTSSYTNDLLYSTTLAASDNSATFSSFAHSYAYITLNIVANGEYSSGFGSLDISVGNSSGTIYSTPVDCEQGATSLTHSFYVAAQSEDMLPLVKIYLSADGGTTTFSVTPYTATATTPITSWDGGNYYTYNDILLGTTDVSNLGTEEAPFLVYSADEFASIGSEGSEWTMSSHYRLMSDITLPDSWTPIGTEAVPFTGSFDGYGHQISCSSIKTDLSYIGIFCYVGEGGSISNLSVVGSRSNTSTNVYVGGIVGCLYKGTISNCVNYTHLTSNGRVYAAGVVAYNNGGVVINCINRGDITLSTNSYGYRASGGITATNYGGSIINCYNSGYISGIGRTGGIVGYNEEGGRVINCYNNNTVYMATYVYGGIYFPDDYKLIGAVAGENNSESESTISDCYYVSGSVLHVYYSTYPEYTVGVGGDLSEEGATDDYVPVDFEGETTVCSAIYMMSSEFVDKLNTTAATFNATSADYKACEWSTVTGSYPTLNFGTDAN